MILYTQKHEEKKEMRYSTIVHIHKKLFLNVLYVVEERGGSMSKDHESS